MVGSEGGRGGEDYLVGRKCDDGLCSVGRGSRDRAWMSRLAEQQGNGWWGARGRGGDEVGDHEVHRAWCPPLLLVFAGQSMCTNND